MILLNDSIRKLNKIGPKTEELYNKLGIFNIRDLLDYYPRDYFVYEEPSTESDFTDGKIAAIKGTVISVPILKKTAKGDILIANIRSYNSLFEIIWFKSTYLRSVLKKNTEYIFYGKVNQKNSRFSMIHPKVFNVNEYEKLKGKMLPVYGLTKGLSNKQITNNVNDALEVFNNSDEYGLETLPEVIESKYNFINYGKAINELHFPSDTGSFVKARKRFAYEELFYFKYAMSRFEKNNPDKINYYKINDFSLADRWLNTLPFKATSDQLKAIESIKQDISSEFRMERLLQGDVGSGKTLVAFYACLAVAGSGYQAAFMAPTEVLALQHFETFQKWLKLLDENIKVVLLIGSMKSKDKKEVYGLIESGEANIIVGTHALIQNALSYRNLALTITDEQHRFGVMQRTALMEKGYLSHSLFMTATPIPRTLALLMYGNVSLSELIEKPSNRLPIKNCMIPFNKRKVAFGFIKKEIDAGHQAFIVCSMIEENEMYECENINDYINLVRDFFGNDIRVEALHGKMTASQKEAIMRSFSMKEIDILVSTTVIEVGIDVPNATVMMIENSERFGLSQLHQLRGRVGRGSAQSYCIFVHATDNSDTINRIKVLVDTNDGFKIAKEDLKFRGPGDFFGFRQSGDVDFRFADIFSDYELFNNAKDDLDSLLDDELTENDINILKNGLIRYNKYDIRCI